MDVSYYVAHMALNKASITVSARGGHGQDRTGQGLLALRSMTLGKGGTETKRTADAGGLRPYHYMLPPYKGRRPDGHTRRPSRTLPCFGQLLSVCGPCLAATAIPGVCATSGARTRDLSTTLRPQDLKPVALLGC
jgi:hypothetical protein